MRIFHDAIDRDIFLSTLQRAVSRYGWLCHAYCLMGTHYHLMLETPRAGLAHGMRWLNSVFAQASNARHERRGHLFQGRYKAVLVERDSHSLELARYLSLNPVRAGLCERPEEWPWSSYLATAGHSPAPSFLTLDWLLGQFGPDTRSGRAGYRAFVRDGVGKAGALSVRAGLYIGSDNFVREHAPSAVDTREVPRPQRQPLRPPLGELLRAATPDAIEIAHAGHGYMLREIADYLGIHPATAGRRLQRIRNIP